MINDSEHHSSDSEAKEKVFAEGDKIGNHTVVEHYLRSCFGDVYAVMFGTTHRVYALHIWEHVPGFTKEALAAFVKTVTPLRHPCHTHFFASGEDDGVTWLRSDRCTGAPDRILDTEIALLEDETSVQILTLSALLRLAEGNVAAFDRNIILGDVIEALAYLHARGVCSGALTPEKILLDKMPRADELIAKISEYAWPDVYSEALREKDVHDFADIMKLLLVASPGETVKEQKLAVELNTLAESILNREAPCTADWVFTEFTATLKKHGVTRMLRYEEEEDDKEAQPDNAIVPLNGDKKLRRRGGKKKRKNASSSTYNEKSKMFAALKLSGILIVIFTLAIAVAWGFDLHDKKQRQKVVQHSVDGRYSSVLVIEDGEDAAYAENFPSDIMDYTPEQLTRAAENGNAIAAARYAILVAEGDANNAPDRDKAELLLFPFTETLAAATDADSLYWFAYATLIGLVDGRADADAVARLERAQKAGHHAAAVLLGDYYAVRAPRTAENDLRAMRCWWEIFPAKNFDWTLARREAADRLAYFLYENRGIPPLRRDELIAWMQNTANAKHPRIMMTAARLHTEGRLLDKDFPEALKLYRTIANNANISARMRGEARYMMGKFYAEGRVVQQDVGAAIKQYNYAAELGNPDAMTALAQLAEVGALDKNGTPNPTEAKFWRDKATAAAAAAPEEKIFKLDTPGTHL